ncbi:hypothetical protein HHL16_13920 [Pseudoflavitalea sp. G-6-1-2]|uniref:hypothetical protein n=1 Tax=Pseudoflavitalea sp. G-6-1-2 TaxID=2728841 RepID=UPI00146BDA7E|nr:hypothetical protein [Pseudoflavitalea sp. G-6-1-2]NML21982.1 hypothetical protein [Pseudoflavitalea sp. G-6-1-2]
MTLNKIFALPIALLLLASVACKKTSNDFLYKNKMLPINIQGYNGSGSQLLVTVDTFKFVSPLTTGSFDLSEAYTFPPGKTSVKLSITEKESGKSVLDRELKSTDDLTKISFFYMNGIVADMPAKEAKEDGKLKISYMFMPTVTKYTEPVDIVLGKFYFIPKVFEEITRIKNVKPYEFSQTISLTPFSLTGQTYNGQPTPLLFLAYICKAGTNQFYTEGTEYTWHVSSSTAPKPAANAASSTIYIFSEAPVGNSMRFFKNLEL